MAKEIEKKFLVTNDDYKSLAYKRVHIIQCYLSTEKKTTIRIRIYDNIAYLTIKGISIGIVRDEWEYEIPYSDAMEMINKLSDNKVIEKYRYLVKIDNYLWEIDEFMGQHSGLKIAEIELHEESERFPIPSFVGKEVTGNPKYYNSVLASI